MTSDEKILYVDIEWAPALVYTFDMWNTNVSPDKMIDHGGMLCFCAKWSNSKDFLFFSEWEHGRKGMAQAALELLSEADAVVTYNGDKYDLPKITGEIVLAGLSPPPPVTSIDVIKTIRKMGFNMNRLAYIGPLLGVGEKVKHEGFGLWKDVLDGKEKAQITMRRYCVQDVRLLEKLYKRIRPFIKTHPHMGSTKKECGACGSNHVQSRGYRRTKHYRIQRVQCMSCGSWSEGVRTKVT